VNFSSLFDESTFYEAFINDLLSSTKEVIIESPYITTERMRMLKPVFEELINRGVKIYVMTRDPKEHNENLEIQSEEEIHFFEVLGVQVLLCVGNHHRKLAILDRKILWEGSLNILSQIKSREIMRRIENKKLTVEMFNFLKFEKFI
jgi:phosphatidylserine/phosphatidylglycerophosphate/cardiolipin synthase-like enzyme